MIPYEAPMLSGVDYKSLTDEDEGLFFSLIDLEAGTMENYCDFLTILTPQLKKENLMQTHELLVAHLCAYLAAVLTIHTVRHAEKLESSVIKLIKHQANVAYEQFNQYPINSTAKSREQKKTNSEKLREKAPGSIVVQTIRLGRTIMDALEDLSDHQKKHSAGRGLPKQTELFCSHETLIKIMLLVGSEKCAQWREELGGLSDHYIINQFAIQMGWLIGYFSHLERKSPGKTQYFEYGLPVITLFREHIYQLMEAYAKAEHAQKEAESSELLSEIHQLSEKTHSQKLPAINEFQKQIAKTHAGIEKALIELLNQRLEVKIILMSVFYFWFTLEVPLHSDPPELIKDENPMTHMLPIIELVQETVRQLPTPELSPEIRALNKKMQLLKSFLPGPELLDNVSQENVKQHTEQVNEAIHSLTCDYIKQDIHIEAITNSLFSHWLRLCVFFGVSESEWQKMDYYLPETLKAVRQYLRAIFD